MHNVLLQRIVEPLLSGLHVEIGSDALYSVFMVLLSLRAVFGTEVHGTYK